MYLLWTFIFLLGLQAGLGAQDAKRLERAKKYLRDAEVAYGKANYEGAIQAYQFAATIYRNSDDIDNYSICYNGVGNCYIDLTRYNEARQEFQRVLSLYAEAALRDSSFRCDSNHIADAYEGMGRYYMQVNVNYDSALAYHQRALGLREKLFGAQSAKVALSYYFIGKCQRGFALDSLQAQGQSSTDLNKEREYLERALNIQLSAIKDSSHLYELANTYQAIGDYYYVVRKDYQQGFEYQQQALDLRLKVYGEGHPKIANSYLDLATYYRAVGAFDKELAHLEQALTIQLSVMGEFHKDIAKGYFLLGNRYRSTGDLEKAVSYYKRALAIHEHLRTGASEDVASLYHALGLTYRSLEDRDEDYKYIFKALEMRQQIFGRLHFEVGDSYMELGNYYESQGLSDSMLYYYNLAAEIWAQQLGTEHYRVAQAYDNLARAYALRGEEDKALYYLNESLRKKQQGGKAQVVKAGSSELMAEDGQHNRQDPQHLGYMLFDSYLNLARYYRQHGQTETALLKTQEALAAVCPSLSRYANDPYQNPKVEELSHNIDWLEALQLKGELILMRHQTQKARKDLDFALHTYDLALSLVDTLRLNFASDGSKQQLTKRCIPIFEGKMLVLNQFYLEDKRPEYLQQAFEVMERSKAFVLLQALQNLDLKKNRKLPAELLAREEYLRRNLAYYSNYRNRNRRNAEDFDQAYLLAKRQYDSLISVLEQDYPDYYQLRHQATVASLAQIQNDLLDRDQALLEYFVGDQAIQIFLITRKETQWIKLALPKDLPNLISALYTNLTDYQLVTKNPQQAYRNFTKASFNFYKELAQPALSLLQPSIEKLLIVPDGVLGYIPFEVLLLEAQSGEGEMNYSKLPLLLNRFEVNYSYSATLMLRKNRDNTLKNNGLCLGFAPSYENTQQSFTERHEELPWAERELKSVQQTFAGDYFFGKDATKDVFLEKAERYAILHLATHGTVDLKKSSRSRLAFAQSKVSDEREAAALYAYEIHNLALSADLVVLSACETGFGKIVRGEGVLSLARAFLYAGSSSVITTLWKVNDYTSATLMNFFYENLDQGMSKPEALRQAKLRYLSQADAIAGHPVFWASYIHIGEPSPLRHYWAWWQWTLLVLAVLGSLGGSAYFWKQQQRKKAKLQQLKEGETPPFDENHFMGFDSKDEKPA